VDVQFREIVGNQQERLFAPVRVVAVGGGNLLFYFAAGLGHRIGQERDVLVGSFDAVKRRFGRVTHRTRLSGQPASARSQTVTFSHNARDVGAFPSALNRADARLMTPEGVIAGQKARPHGSGRAARSAQ